MAAAAAPTPGQGARDAQLTASGHAAAVAVAGLTVAAVGALAVSVTARSAPGPIAAQR